MRALKSFWPSSTPFSAATNAKPHRFRKGPPKNRSQNAPAAKSGGDYGRHAPPLNSFRH